jgi:hypothetical protein
MGVSSFVKALEAEKASWATQEVILGEKYGTVKIQALTAAEKEYFVSNFQQWQAGKPRYVDGFQVDMLAKAIIDEKGNRLFNDDTKHLIGFIEAEDLNKLVRAVMKLSGMDTGAVEEATEDLKKDPLPDSGLNSPENSEEQSENSSQEYQDGSSTTGLPISD